MSLEDKCSFVMNMDNVMICVTTKLKNQEHDSYDHKCIVSASSGHPGQRYNRVPGKKHNIIANRP